MAESGGKWRKLRALSAWQWRVMLMAQVILPLTSMRLRRTGLRATLAWVRSKGPGASNLPCEQERGLAQQTAYAVNVAARYGIFRPACLTRSLALGRILGRRGIPFEIRIGVPATPGQIKAPGAPDLHAHAWVESMGVVLNDREDIGEAFIPFESQGPNQLS